MRNNNSNNINDPIKPDAAPSINMEGIPNRSRIDKICADIKITDMKGSLHLPKEYALLSKLSYKELLTNPILDFAARTWEEDRYQGAQVCYSYMRIIDDLIDNRKADAVSLSESEKEEFSDMVNECIKAINDEKPNELVKKELVETIKRFGIPLWPLQRFSRSMIYDIQHDGFETFNSFLKYTEGAAIGDFQKDQNNNLNYFAEDLVIKNGLDLEMLKEIANGGEIHSGFRNLIQEYYNYADHYRIKTRYMINKINPKLEPRYRDSFELIYNLYYQIFERIDVKNGEFTTKELNPSPNEVKERIDQTINKTINF
jgi:phytoene/squalene synthetase